MYSTLTSLQRKRYLFVCINRRAEDNPKGCCAAKDLEEVYRALKAEIAARGLAKLEARLCTSSCLDQCATARETIDGLLRVKVSSCSKRRMEDSPFGSTHSGCWIRRSS